MRIAIGGLSHESNTFTHRTTSFEAFDTVEGAHVFEKERWTARRSTGGIIDTLAEVGADVVPTFFAKGLPSGTVEAAAFRRMADEITSGIEAAGPVDGVCLDLHGSMYAEDCADPEGELLERIRAIVGDETPIVCALDMHATITDRLIDNVDGITGYRTAPHTDVYETGERAASLLLDVVEGDADLVVEWEYLPMLLAGEQSETDAPPMDRLMDRLRSIERRSDVLSAAYFLGFPWADSPHGGVSAVVVGESSSQDVVRSTATSLAREFWECRDQFSFTTEAYPLNQALDEALDESDTPVIVADSGDNPTAGAAEDLTIVLERVLERGVDDALFAVIADREVVRTCREAGEGSAVALELGRLSTEPDASGLNVEATVRILGSYADVDAAVLDIDGVTVVVTPEPTAVTDPSFLRDLGVSPEDYGLLVVKSGYLSPAYQRLAGRTMLALTPGDTNEVLTELPYENVPRPTYPLDEKASWSPSSE